MIFLDPKCPEVRKFVCDLLNNPLDSTTTIEDMINGDDPDEDELQFFESVHVEKCERCKRYDEEWDKKQRNYYK
jgi:hypothetical protein